MPGLVWVWGRDYTPQSPLSPFQCKHGRLQSSKVAVSSYILIHDCVFLKLTCQLQRDFKLSRSEQQETNLVRANTIVSPLELFSSSTLSIKITVDCPSHDLKLLIFF